MVINVIMEILAIFFTIIGFIGFYCDIFLLSIAFFIFYIIEIIIGIYSGKLHDILTSVIAIIIGAIVSFYFDTILLDTIIIALCYESAIMSLCGIIMLISFLKK